MQEARKATQMPLLEGGDEEEGEHESVPTIPEYNPHFSVPPSNQKVLKVVMVLFALFVCGEIVAALLSHSLSLLGDAGAMSVDVFSYGTNMLAEKIKARDGNLSKQQRFLLEVAVPSFSVLSLLGVTAWITTEAVRTLMYPAPEDEDVNIYVLWGFSSLNMVVDIASFYMFWLRRGEVFYYELVEPVPAPRDTTTADSFPGKKIEHTPQAASPGGTIPHHRKANLNMLSAFSHVGGDTLRTLSIFVAAAYATATGTPGYIVDAWATAVVTITIIAMVTPLSIEIWRSYLALVSI